MSGKWARKIPRFSPPGPSIPRPSTSERAGSTVPRRRWSLRPAERSPASRLSSAWTAGPWPRWPSRKPPPPWSTSPCLPGRPGARVAGRHRRARSTSRPNWWRKYRNTSRKPAVISTSRRRPRPIRGSRRRPSTASSRPWPLSWTERFRSSSPWKRKRTSSWPSSSSRRRSSRPSSGAAARDSKSPRKSRRPGSRSSSIPCTSAPSSRKTATTRPSET